MSAQYEAWEPLKVEGIRDFSLFECRNGMLSGSNIIRNFVKIVMFTEYEAWETLKVEVSQELVYLNVGMLCEQIVI